MAIVARYVKEVSFSMEGISKGNHFCQKWYVNAQAYHDCSCCGPCYKWLYQRSRCWSMLFCVFYADLRLKRVVFQAQFLTRSEEALPVICDHHHHLYSLYTARTSGCQ